MAPALAAGGQALGLGAGSRARVGRALLPAQRLAATRSGQASATRRTGENIAGLTRDNAALNESAGLSAALYPMRTSAAGNKGAMLRTGGDLMTGAGMNLAVASMNQKAPGVIHDAAGNPLTDTQVAEMTDAYGGGPGPEDVAAAQAADGNVAQGEALYAAWPQIRSAGNLLGLRARGAWNRARATPPARPMAAG